MMESAVGGAMGSVASDPGSTSANAAIIKLHAELERTTGMAGEGATAETSGLTGTAALRQSLLERLSANYAAAAGTITDPGHRRFLLTQAWILALEAGDQDQSAACERGLDDHKPAQLPAQQPRQ